MTDTIRASFVAEFGEQQAVAVEQAGQGHYAAAQYDPTLRPIVDIGELFATLVTGTATTGHATDEFGTSPFRYWFLLAIGYECLTRYRDQHGITIPVADLKTWALTYLHDHDGDWPDHLALAVGGYDDWIQT